MDIKIKEKPSFIVNQYYGRILDSEGKDHPFWVVEDTGGDDPPIYRIDWFFKGVSRDLKKRSGEIIEHFKQTHANIRKKTKMGEL